MTLITNLLAVALGVALLLLAALGLLPALQGGPGARLLPLLPRKPWPRRALAMLCALAGALALAGVAVPFVAFFGAAAALLASLLSLGGAWRARAGTLAAVPALLVLASVAVGAGQPLGLKVLALPKADVLPYAPARARVVKTYDEGTWFEGIAAGPDGTLYLAASRKLDFSRPDYWRQAEGEIIARSPSGEERSVLKTPPGSAAGVVAVGADGTLYMTSNGALPGLWRVRPGHAPEKFATLPRGAWPNGLDIGPDGQLYTPDSALGRVWRVDPRTGEARDVLDDARLLARPWISLAPGANGLHFRGREMIVTVSDRTTVLGYALREDGRFDAPHLIASGIPGDDFAVGPDGSLFITTHPYDTVVRVTPAGERSIAGDARQHIVGATDAVFGRGPDDRDTLYVVTDGGAFTGGPRTRGQLVALKLR